MPNLNLSDKVKAKYALIIICVFVALSVGLAFWHWYIFCIPTIIAYIVEWICRANFGQYGPPGYKYVFKEINDWRYRKQRVANDLPIPDEHIRVAAAQPSKLITLSEWLVTDMIDANCNKNYTSCGGYEHYQLLINQYTDAKNDDKIVSYKELMKRKLLVSSIYTGVQFNIEILNERYSPISAEYLANLPFNWNLPTRPFTPESYKDDCKYLSAALISKKIELERIDKQLESYFTEGKTETADQQTQRIEDFLAEMAVVHPGTVYVLEGMKVSKLASLERAYNRHVKFMIDQSKNKK